MMTTLTLLAVLSLAVASIYFASRTKASANDLLHTGVNADRIANQVEMLLQQHRSLATREASVTADPDERIAGQRRIEQEIRNRLAFAAARAGSADASFNQFTGLLSRELPELYATLDEGDYAIASNHVLSEITKWRAQRDWILDRRVGEFFGSSDRLILWVYAGTFGTLLIGVLSFAMMERLLARMGAIQRTMLRLAFRNLDVSIPSLNDGDEIGEVARAVEVFKRNAIQFAAQQEELRRNGLKFEAAMNNMSQGLVLYDTNNRLDVFNVRYCEIFNLDPADLRAGMAIVDVLNLVVQAGNYSGSTLDEVVAVRMEVVNKRTVDVSLHQIGGGRVVAISHCPMSDGGWVATCEDVTARQAAEAQIRYLAQHDSLTGLANRVVLNEGLERALTVAGRGISSAVLCLDLDRFKAVNDTLGHYVGDQLLRAVAERLLACVREGDVVARLGGDEFAIIQSGVTRPEETKLLAERILEAMQAAFVVSDNQIVIGTSIGLALIPQDGSSAVALLKNADTALYRAKADGRGGFCFFEAEMDARLQQRRQLELDMRRGLIQREFEVAYQPLVNLEAHEVCGFEALLRWRHPERGMVSPSEFIPIAEEIGLIVPLGEWVLDQACLDAATWPDGIKVAVNLSPVQFKSKNLVAAVARALKNSGLPARRLELEITETVLLQESATTLAILHELRGLGARISMDDFGTGYSSLSYLRSFPFDKIKIDQSFIRDLSSREDSIHIVRAVRGLCAGLGMLTTAEGVETEDQLRKLRAEGCTEVQGFLFSAPRPACDIPGIMRSVGEDMDIRARQATAELWAADKLALVQQRSDHGASIETLVCPALSLSR